VKHPYRQIPHQDFSFAVGLFTHGFVHDYTTVTLSPRNYTAETLSPQRTQR
jgi:hypothetical protein